MLLAWGADDPFFPLALAERLRDAIPRARLSRIAGSRAFVPEDQPERLAALMDDFLREPLPVPAPYEVVAAPRPNALLSLFDPAGLRPHVVNWDEVAAATLERLHREWLATGRRDKGDLLAALAKLPGVPSGWREPAVRAPAMVLPIVVRLGGAEVKLFSTFTTLGTPQDVTLDELRIESFHPADEETERLARALAAT